MEYTEELGRSKIPQAKTAEDGECFGGRGRGCLRGNVGISVKRFCRLMMCMSAEFEDILAEGTGTHV